MNLWRNILLGIFIAINLLIASATIFAAYAGHISPNEMAIAPIACMLLPFAAIVTLGMIPISFLIKKWTSLIPIATVIICLSPLLNLCPLNAFNKNDHKKNSNNDFSLLCYNA